jgi:alpha-galactosidase
MDDCWSATTRDANGNLQPEPSQFPNGMKALADYVHSKGLKIGLYTCAGTETCRGKRPGSFGHYTEVRLLF